MTVCKSYHKSAIAHSYADSVADVTATYDNMCANGTGAQWRSYFVVLTVHSLKNKFGNFSKSGVGVDKIDQTFTLNASF